MKLYFFKENPKQFQIFPVPENLEDFLVVEVESEAEAYDKQAVLNDKGEVELIEVFDIEEAKKELLKQVNAKADLLYENYLSYYPKVERTTFSRQLLEAKAFLENQASATNNTSPAELLEAKAEAFGISDQELATKIVDKNRERMAVENSITTQVMAFRSKIHACQTKAEIEEIGAGVEGWTLEGVKTALNVV